MPSSFSVGYSELLLASRLIAAGRNEQWTFEVVAANCGARRSFLIATGLDQVLEILTNAAIADEDVLLLDQASASRRLNPPLLVAALEKVAKLRFSGDIFAVPEGTVLFADEPILRLRAPAPEAVMVGAAVLAALRAQTAVATKAARLKIAAAGKPLYELGPSAFTREGGLVAARAAYVGGLSATTHPLAAGTWGIPVLPVVSLAQVTAMGAARGDLAACGILLDGAAPAGYEAALAHSPAKPRALLADVTGSSEQTAQVLALRARMNGLGWSDVALIGTGDLDEARIEELAKASVPLDGFGIGASLLIGADATALSFEYELVERNVDGKRLPCFRRDGGEGPRAVWRKRESGRFKGDTVQSEQKAPPGGAMPLLVPMMEKGKRLFRSPSVSEVRGLCEAQLSMLDPLVTRRVDPAIYPVLVVVEPAARPAPSKAPARASPIDAAGARAQRFNQLDDSADFSAMSSAFASVVAERLAEDAVEPIQEPNRESEPTEPSPEASREGELEAPAFEEIVDAPDHSFEGLDHHVVKDLPPQAPKSEPEAAPTVVAPMVTAPVITSSSGPSDPLLAAAARLRSMQGGRAPSLPMNSEPAPAPRPPPAPSAAAPSNGKDPSDPLLAAAARLKSMRKN